MKCNFKNLICISQTIVFIMHLSMLGRRGGRRGKGAGFDEKVYPVSGEFDDQYSPGGRGI